MNISKITFKKFKKYNFFLNYSTELFNFLILFKTFTSFYFDKILSKKLNMLMKLGNKEKVHYLSKPITFHKYFKFNKKISDKSFNNNNNWNFRNQNLTNTNIDFLVIFLNHFCRTSQFLINANFYFHNFKGYKNDFVLLKLENFLKKWKELYNLINNIFYYNYHFFTFTSKYLKHEVLSLNWNFKILEFSLWTHIQPMFYSQINYYSKTTSYFFEKTKKFNANFAIITDCSFHKIILALLNKKNFFIIGLAEMNINPWKLSFFIPTLTTSFFIQFFFLKFLLLTQKKSSMLKFISYKKKWKILKTI